MATDENAEKLRKAIAEQERQDRARQAALAKEAAAAKAAAELEKAKAAAHKALGKDYPHKN
jgi:hypothetical protein